MPVPGFAVPRQEFVRTLLHRGSPPERPDAGEDLGAVGDATLARAARYWVVVPIAYRIAAFVKVFIGFAAANGGAGLVPVLPAAALGVAANAGFLWWLLRSGGLPARRTRRVLTADLGAGLVLNLLIAVLAPDAVQPFAIDVTWTWLVGSVAMWAGTSGLPAALLLLAAAVPVRVLLTVAGGLRLDNPLAINRSIGCLVALAVSVVVACGILVLLGVGTRFALDIGLRRGQEAERRRTQRLLHDSVLQTLEALAIAPADDADHAAERLAQLRSVAHAEAAELRRSITEPIEPRTGRGFVVELADVAAEMAREGLRTQLVAADFADDDRLSADRRTAMCEAVREALRNTVKHAGTSRVVLRVEERDGGTAVVARDQGRGFDVRERGPGFGIRQSIEARLAEVGGTGRVESAPGHGTRVTLWVPH
ncbi:ATP-binding protein [Amycolatopsis rubida]|uniref:histidine kinase n=1 Tax=Amycolatopsis rubida TaxID=112413 RepID=A0ABX0C1F1_9PSEU|nr:MULTISPECIES: ATP-binding protein [Amycolatopsis]MYW96516.1 ATP-binding protein [Amycolatopsis rubida]NEC61501.1 ATP-binding protein [Amycolatopsis rubida]OAP25865.1 Sensor histidine kinase LiaS [Amycolatopsis sp. M39]